MPGEVLNSAVYGDEPIFVVNVSPRIIDALVDQVGGSLKATFADGTYVPTSAIRPGDVISVTIYETGGSSLFAPPPTVGPPAPVQPQPSGSSNPLVQIQGPQGGGGRTTTVPPQVVEANGEVMVPFVGRMKVGGRTPEESARVIENALKSQTITPQVVVTPVVTVNQVSIGGEATRPGPMPLTLRGERVLDAIAFAGGSKYLTYDTYVRVIRGSTTGTISLERILADPEENIVLRPKDQLVLIRYPRSFSVMGATAKVSQYTFDVDSVTLAEAVARAGGPIDTIASPSGIYLFRYEPIRVARAIFEAMASDNDMQLVDGNESWLKRKYVRLLYHVDLRTANGYFLAQRMPIHDKDVVLISNAEATQLSKALQVARGLTGIAFDLRN